MQPNRIQHTSPAQAGRFRLGRFSTARVGALALVWSIAASMTLALGQSPATSTTAAPPGLDPESGLGSWIWKDETRDWQTCRFWRAFEIPESPGVKRAWLRVTADDCWDLFLDGKELGGGLGQFQGNHDVSSQLKPGRHVLAVEAGNNTGSAGMRLGLRVELQDGSLIELASDSSWKIVPNNDDQWAERTEASATWSQATVVAALNASRAHQRPRAIGSWIWTEPTREQQTCRFWQSFKIPDSPIQQAWLYVTADNSYTLFLDGHELGKGAEWRNLNEYDLKPLLKPGAHVFAVEAFNDNADAGMVFGLQVELANGSTVELKSDSTWAIASNTDKRWTKRAQAPPAWPHAKELATFGTAPWWQGPMRLLKATPLQPTVLSFWQTAWFQIALLSFCTLVVLLCLRLWARLAVQSQAQRAMHRERERIARDIHDDLKAGLTQIVLLGEIAQREYPDDSKPRKQFDQISTNARELLIAMGEVIWAVNSHRDTLKDFTSYTCRYTQQLLQSTDIQCQFDVDDEIAAVSCGLDIRRNLFLAVKEALNNAVRHSGATEVFLRIHRHGEELTVVVEDNGKGFDPASTDHDHNGLANMQQRAIETGGACRIVSQPGSGCRVELTVPLQPASRKWWPWRALFPGH